MIIIIYLFIYFNISEIAGIGEYVLQPASGGSDGQESFSVSANAVLVHEAHPAALSQAVLFLLSNYSLRGQIGRAGRRTVVKYFNTQRQMSQYAELYSQLQCSFKR